jgi:hypothetical protein
MMGVVWFDGSIIERPKGRGRWVDVVMNDRGFGCCCSELWDT